MRISIGNKLLTHKPNTQQEKSRYFKGLKFKTEDFSNDKIREMIGKGTTITYLYKDDVLTEPIITCQTTIWVPNSFVLI